MSADRWAMVSSFRSRSLRRSLHWFIRSKTTACQKNTQVIQEGSRNTAIIFKEMRKMGDNYSLSLTLSCSIFCSEPFIVSVTEFRFCSRSAILDAFKTQTRQPVLATELQVLSFLFSNMHAVLRTDLLLILHHQVWDLFPKLCVLLHRFNKLSEGIHKHQSC